MTRNSRSLAKTARRLNMKKEAALPALSTLAVLIGSLASTGANANPTGGKVIAGSANISDRGNGTLDITQSTGKAIINWKDFSIGANETVNFRQPGSNSVTLNRVVGNDPSAIFGRLNANGTVMLVNPNGVVFGKGARVDVGGLVATTANINDKDFLAGNYKFNQPSSKRGAMIVNEGTISIKDSGLAALVAPAVRNSGVIEAKLGRVALAGAKTVTVDFHGDGLLSFDATSAVADLPKDADGKPVSALVANNGVIRADGGTVLMTARAVKGVIDNVVNTDGIVSAKSVGTQNGKIVLSGGDAGTVRIA
ncbi:two-partner secretion domain-containing protein, partial [Achromobacter insolitus]